MLLKIIFIVLIALQVADALTTYIGLSSGIAHEGNPLVAWIGNPLLIVLPSKVIVSTLLAISVRKFAIVGGRYTEVTRVFALLAMYYAVVVLNNYVVLIS